MATQPLQPLPRYTAVGGDGYRYSGHLTRAQAQCDVDGFGGPLNPGDPIRNAPWTIVEEHVAPVGRTAGLAPLIIWADARISSEYSPLASTIPVLPAAACTLLEGVYGSDTPIAQCVGGPLVLASVTDVREMVVEADPRRTRGGYQSPEIRRLDVALADGSTHTWYVAVEGYPEGYTFELALTLDEARATFEGRDAQLALVELAE